MRHAFFAFAALLSFSVPAYAETPVDPEFTARVESAIWSRKIEVWRLTQGRNPHWTYGMTRESHGDYPEPPAWPGLFLKSHRSQREQARYEIYGLTVWMPELDRTATVFLPHDLWLDAAESGEIRMTVTATGDVIPLACENRDC